MDCTYNPGHDERYAHIPPEQRWEYPDEVRIDFDHFIREKTYKELCEGVDIETALRLVGWGGRKEQLEKRIGRPLPDPYWFGGEILFLAKDVSIKKTYTP